MVNPISRMRLLLHAECTRKASLFLVDGEFIDVVIRRMIGYELRNATHFVNFTSRLSVCQLYGPERDFPCLLGGGSFRIRDAVFRTSEVSPKTCHTSGRQSAAQPPKATARATKLRRCYAYSEAEPRRFAVTPRAARVSGREGVQCY